MEKEIPVEFLEWIKEMAEKNYNSSAYQKPLGKTMWMEASEKMARDVYKKLTSK